MTEYLSGVFCEHANECPANSGPDFCECPKNCACREHMCKPRGPSTSAAPAPALPTMESMVALAQGLESLKQQLSSQLAQTQDDNDLKQMLQEFNVTSVAQLKAVVKEEFAKLHSAIQHHKATYAGYQFNETTTRARTAQMKDEQASDKARIAMLEAQVMSLQMEKMS